LTQMNVQLANAISNIGGLTGQAIIRAIPTGERDPEKLAALSHPRIQASQKEIATSLECNWRPELLFMLQQEVDMYDAYRKRISECDRQLQIQLASYSAPADEQTFKRKKKKAKNAPDFDLGAEFAPCHGC